MRHIPEQTFLGRNGNDVVLKMNAFTENKNRNYGLLFLWIFLIALSLTINMRSPFPYFYFFADESTYYTMGYSLAYDFDLQYEEQDLERVYQEWEGGPTGIFLKKGLNNTITFGKSYLYPLIASIPLRFLGTNGFLFVNVIALALMISCGTLYISRWNDGFRSLLFVTFFFILSANWVYVFWIHPELTIQAFVLLGTFFWMYTSESGKEIPFGHLLISAVFLGLATFGKVTNAIYFVPPLVYTLFQLVKSFQGAEERKAGYGDFVVKIVAAVILFLMIIFLLFGINKALTGDWNYQWGERKGFGREFPLLDSKANFDSVGSQATRSSLEIKADPLLLVRNCYYFFIGRFGGIVPHFFGVILAMYLFFRGKKDLRLYLLLAAFCIQQFFYFIFLTDNYLGGMGAVGNRYFLNSFPLFLFFCISRISWRLLLVFLIVASFFVTPLLLNPFSHSSQPAEHTFRFPYKFLPVELSQMDFLPVHANHHLSRRLFDGEIPYRVTFLDYNTYLPEEGGFWVRPERSAEILIETSHTIRGFRVFIRNGNQGDNRISFSINGKKQRNRYNTGELRNYEFIVSPCYTHREEHIYSVTIFVEKGFIPRFHEEGSTDMRYLGCYIRIEPFR